MRRRRLWAGIDLGVETASVCVIGAAGEVLHEGACSSSVGDVRRQLTSFRRTSFESVVFESGMGSHVARGLKSLGYPVELYEVRQLSKFLRARRNKTDAGDARGIAEAGRIGTSMISKVYLKSLTCQMLQSRLSIRRHLISQRIAAYHMVCRQLELFGGRLHCNLPRDSLGAAVDEEIGRIGLDLDDPLVNELRFIARHCDQLITHQRETDLELKKLAFENDVCRRLMEIPGVGVLCALSFFAAVDDPHRFNRTASIGAYFGLAPRLRQSGLSSRKSRISKMGNKHVRSLLVHAASMHLKWSGEESKLRDWTLHIQERRGRLPSRVALARKLAIIMIAMWKARSHFDCAPRSPNPTVGRSAALVAA